MTTPSILFVDDDPNVLQALNRMLRHKRSAWRMAFAIGGKQALALMDLMPVDVLVSDMRMPEMDGAALLAETAQRHPDTIRFILSGQSSQESLFRAIGPCHQYLSKPCEGRELEERIEAALTLRQRLGDAALRALVGKLEFLPSLPAVYQSLLAELESGQPSQERIERALAGDPGVAAKLLQIANSAYFPGARQIHSVWQAANFLGYEIVRALALGCGVTAQARRPEIGGMPTQDILHHGLVVAGLARDIARAEQLAPAVIDDCFSAGILHDLGVLVLVENFAERYAPVVSAARHDAVPLHLAERSAFGVCHADIGAYLLGTWGLPDSLVRAVADHHRAPRPGLALNAASVLYVANALTTERAFAMVEARPDFMPEVADARRASWRAMCDRALEGVA